MPLNVEVLSSDGAAIEPRAEGEDEDLGAGRGQPGNQSVLQRIRKCRDSGVKLSQKLLNPLGKGSYVLTSTSSMNSASVCYKWRTSGNGPMARSPETINYRTLKPEKDGLFCEKISPTLRLGMPMRRRKRVRLLGIICERCGVEVTRAKVRERDGPSSLPPVTHIWYFKRASRLGYLLTWP